MERTSFDRVARPSAESPAAQPISVVVPTRGRPTHADACVETILRCDGLFELIVVDQTDGPATEDALRRHLADPRVRYVRSPSRGVAAARNEGIALSRGNAVAFTDDDCRVPPHWVGRIADLLASDPEVAVICGRVDLPSGSEHQGHAASFEPIRRVYRGGFPPPGADWGISANMTIRRSALERVGRFDALLGAGAPLRGGAETDLLARVLAAGLKVVNAAEIELLHLGIRRHGAEARKLWHGYGVGAGAAFAKHARMGGRQGRQLYARWLRYTLGRNLRSVLTRTRPTHLTFTLGFITGSLASYRYAIDPADGLYVTRGQPLAR